MAGRLPPGDERRLLPEDIGEISSAHESPEVLRRHYGDVHPHGRAAGADGYVVTSADVYIPAETRARS